MTHAPSKAKKPVSGIPLLIQKFDTFQQRHPILGFPLAVLKKFGDDDGGYHAALLTYYGFLSLFPLLLVLVTVLQMWFGDDPVIQQRVTDAVNEYLPLIGSQLQEHIHTMGRAGLGLIIGLLVAIYGARGAADALRYCLNSIWQVPKNRRAGFPKSLLQSLSIMAGVALGFLVMVGVSSFTSVFGHAIWVKVLANALGFAVSAGTILFVFYRSTTRRVPLKDMIPGAMLAAFLVQLLVTFGGLLVSHQLKGLNAVYGTFALVLGLFFWLYLMARVIVYAVEIDSVRHLRLWPRALQSDKPTEADLRAYALYANVESYIPQEQIDVRFKH